MSRFIDRFHKDQLSSLKTKNYSLHAKMIVQHPGFFGPKMIVWLSTRLEIEALSHIFLLKPFYIKKSFDTATFGGVSK